MIDQNLDQDRPDDMVLLLQKYDDLFDEKPGLTKDATMTINTGDAPPVSSPPYRIPQARQGIMQTEVADLL